MVNDQETTQNPPMCVLPAQPNDPLTPELEERLLAIIGATDEPKEKIVDVLYILQNHYGYLSDTAVREAARIMGLAPLQIEELATFYDYLYREPIGRYVIHVCDGVVCWMHNASLIFDHLCSKLGVRVGETTEDGMFTIMPTACIGDCHNAPSMLVNGRFYGRLTPEKIDDIIAHLRENYDEESRVLCR
ncbi:NADH dehydrogenase (ubiquinone) 24 kDa subunit [Desulfovibrio sp. X2]|uniref:NADH-quinone oxidoreductase subunit NuoE n=1 Tax=Desulfovibrio sp. X2 TaxID=941449 RepID=UPI000358F147|nr:NADH-quinone oxidoreductase subunit NuoE [Desulfovibrio sp. X2]EPR43560.1 NADH dehydrogenase (ubiquinone) 24 kDa subunit [Desulfovibrio sp. X2]